MNNLSLNQALNEPFSERNAAIHMNAILKSTDIPAYMIAQGIGMQEKQLNRIKNPKNKPRRETLHQIERIRAVIREAYSALTHEGATQWLQTPNPYLSDVAPVQCLRSDKEMEKVLGLLVALKHGFPA